MVGGRKNQIENGVRKTTQLNPMRGKPESTQRETRGKSTLERVTNLCEKAK